MRATPPRVFVLLSCLALGLAMWPTAAHAQIMRGPFPIYPPYGRSAYPTSDIRVVIQPKAAEVYVDGYFAGTADDFDGMFQRLRVLPGPHEIVIFLQGYRSYRERAYFTPDSKRTIRHALEPLPAGAPNEPRPVPTSPPPDESTSGGRGGRRAGPRYPEPPGSEPRKPEGPPLESWFGTLAITIQPPNADVWIDGQRWRGPGRDGRLTVEVPEGRHRVEIERRGFERFSTDVEIARGETKTLNVSLSPRER